MASCLSLFPNRVLFFVFLSVCFSLLAFFEVISPYFLLINFLSFPFVAYDLCVLSREPRRRAAGEVSFSLDITVTYYLSGQVERTATFTRSLHLPADAFSGESARAAVLAALPDLHVVDDAYQARMSRKILRSCNSWVSRCLNLNNRSGFNDDWILTQHYSVDVDELPPVTEFYVGALPPDTNEWNFDDDVHDHFDDDDYEDTDTDTDADTDDATGGDGIGFLSTSKESIAGLEKEKIEKTLTCSVCLAEAPAGSELTRLPCSHCYHAECIVPWLERSKFCPYCRFELP